MIKIKFTKDDVALFENTYLAFITSERIANRVDELPIVLNIMNQLQAISEPIENHPLRLRKLKAEGGEIILEEVERKYFEEALSPPNGKWNNIGAFIAVEILSRLREKK